MKSKDIMDKKKRSSLEKRGWHFGDAQDFLSQPQKITSQTIKEYVQILMWKYILQFFIIMVGVYTISIINNEISGIILVLIYFLLTTALGFIYKKYIQRPYEERFK
jgi:hypothetical protein